VVHPQATLRQEKSEFFRGSDHNQAGFMVAAGPDIQARGAIADTPIQNLAPTFLSLMAQPISSTLSGQCSDILALLAR
ncbi:MAG: hypothetical protein AAGF98_17150, partial [Cyanobacteria bacterium P01_H01_bin.153]